jgi:hypothetical protein
VAARALPRPAGHPSPPTASRERHEFEVWWRVDDGRGARARLSPAYRLRLAAEASPEHLAAWTEHDVASSYLSRWWLGGGVDYRDGEVGPLLRGEVELDLGDARLRLEARLRPSGWDLGVGATFRVGAGLRLSWWAPGGVGVGIDW